MGWMLGRCSADLERVGSKSRPRSRLSPRRRCGPIALSASTTYVGGSSECVLAVTVGWGRR